MPRFNRKWWGVWVVAGALAVIPGPLASGALAEGDDAGWQVLEEHWYVLELNGTEAGWVQETVKSDGTRYAASTDVNMKIDPI